MMPFLTPAELSTVIPEDVRTQMSATEDVARIIAEEQAKMASYLENRYDTEAIFAAAGDERALVVLAHLKAMVLSCIYAINGRELNEVAQSKLEEALRWLEAVATGKLRPALPRKDTDQDGSPEPHLALGSRPKYQTDT